ncbi:putative ribonuclease H-like domain-containing protein [Tanacetum coccineum]
MQPTFCILQDIRTGAIIGRGTERQGLYYVDELTTSGTVMLAHRSSEREAWLWHRRLGHPSGADTSNDWESKALYGEKAPLGDKRKYQRLEFWAGNIGDRRSNTLGFFSFFGGILYLAKQRENSKVFTLSSEEEEERRRVSRIAKGITKVLWIRRLLTEIGYPSQEPSKVMSDNKACRSCDLGSI